ncbi:acyl-CoA N-acyltransferase [Mucidula mucida]|nr:acyl-CoA N-acyltransferase [Mucidula mucida]
MSAPSPPAHEVILVTSDDLIQQCYDIRINVFHYEQGFPLETEIDDLDPGATHFLLRLVPSLKPIGTIRGIKSPEGYYKLSRLAVLKDYRQFKFGRKLVLTLHDWVKTDALVHKTVENDVVRVISHSQLYVKGFYAKFGYVEEGEEFDEEGDPHQKMVLHLPISTPQGNSN